MLDEILNALQERAAQADARERACIIGQLEMLNAMLDVGCHRRRASFALLNLWGESVLTGTFPDDPPDDDTPDVDLDVWGDVLND